MVHVCFGEGRARVCCTLRRGIPGLEPAPPFCNRVSPSPLETGNGPANGYVSMNDCAGRSAWEKRARGLLSRGRSGLCSSFVDRAAARRWAPLPRRAREIPLPPLFFRPPVLIPGSPRALAPPLPLPPRHALPPSDGDPTRPAERRRRPQPPPLCRLAASPTQKSASPPAPRPWWPLQGSS